MCSISNSTAQGLLSIHKWLCTDPRNTLGFPGTMLEQLQPPLTPAPRPTLTLHTKHSLHGRSTSPAHRHTQVPTDTPAVLTSPRQTCKTKPNLPTQPTAHTAQVHADSRNLLVHTLPRPLLLPPFTLCRPHWGTSSHTVSQLFRGGQGCFLSEGGGADRAAGARSGGCGRVRNCIHMHGLRAQRAAARSSAPAGPELCRDGGGPAN